MYNASNLGATLTDQASFVRQQLSLLSSVSYYNTLCAPSCTPSTRLPFVRLYSALFHSSTYTSCQPNFVEPLLPLYAGSLHIADRLILDMWQTFESVRHLSVTSILRNWSANGLSGLTGAGKALDALVSLDSGRVMATCVNFPLRRTLAVQDQDRPQEPTPYGQTKQVKVKTTEPWGEQEEKGYDPVFVLNLLGGVLAASEVPPGKEQGEEEQYEEAESEETQYQLSGLDWVEIIRSDTLGVAVCALASRDAEMRRLAGHVLSRVMAQIQVSLPSTSWKCSANDAGCHFPRA
jgi:nucleolar pre-ribosomal-associated protein 1